MMTSVARSVLHAFHGTASARISLVRIAQIAPLYESVPPRLYGGTERVVSYLTEELLRQGHDVTLFASGDSQTEARLVPCSSMGLRLDPKGRDIISPHVLMTERVLQRQDDFDVIHFHIEPFHFPILRQLRTPAVTTLHGRLDLPCLRELFDAFPRARVVSISNAQRAPLPRAAWETTVYHGLPAQLLRPGAGRGGYLAFLGRVSREKGPEAAIQIAKRTGIPLKIGAKIGAEDRAYFERTIRPLLSDPLIEFVGEIGEREKADFLGGARALLFPIEWPEPFGLVLIESLACGTPVIAFDDGSVREILSDGVSGMIVRDVDEAVDAVHRIDTIDRTACRHMFEERFTTVRMARDYAAVYARITERGRVFATQRWRR